MLTRYGTDNIVIMLITSLILIGLTYFIANPWFKGFLLTLGIIIALFTVWFFRDPDRMIPQEALNDESVIIAPADGKVVEVIEEVERHFIKKEAIRMSIFLSPLDVHVNRSPVSGEIKFYHYFPGDYLVAWHPKSSELNEHTQIGIENKYGKVFFKQIVGFLARRIVCEAKVGDSLSSGEKFGMMKFGSRMDIAVPTDSEILIKKGDVVVAGETIIARLKK